MSRVHLSRMLVLEAPERLADGAGGYTESWVAKGTLWADVQARAGRERDGGEVSLARMGYRIIVRGAPQGAASRPVPGMRFREGTRFFRIEAVSERDPQGRTLTCFASEEVAL
ncbi:head-tail adaptor protein [Shimia sediminis]|uniref:head-tail adaptor protein n=1 Tax=Shimia sediminis TaxID=2497945 RepID=UPI000F8D2342|nr:head-tail adaptor protein [Shimia sediminis]